MSKKMETLSTENYPTATILSRKKQFSVQVLRMLQMICALELKPHIHDYDDLLKKFTISRTFILQ